MQIRIGGTWHRNFAAKEERMEEREYCSDEQCVIELSVEQAEAVCRKMAQAVYGIDIQKNLGGCGRPSWVLPGR
jgi:hypothetical protein